VHGKSREHRIASWRFEFGCAEQWRLYETSLRLQSNYVITATTTWEPLLLRVSILIYKCTISKNISPLLIDLKYRPNKKQSSPATRHGGAWGERRHSSYSFLTSVLNWVSGQHHAPAAICPGERTPGTHCTGGWVDLIAGMDTEVRGKILYPCWG
jgi:hypothetical protein